VSPDPQPFVVVDSSLTIQLGGRRVSGRQQLMIALGWSALSVSLLAVSPWLVDSFGTGALAPAIAVILVGVLSLRFVSQGVRARETRRSALIRGAVGHALVLSVAMLVSFVPAWSMKVRVNRHFTAQRAELDRFMATELTRATPRKQREIIDDRVVVEAGLPVRVAFTAPCEINFSRCAIVYDASGYLLDINALYDRARVPDPKLMYLKDLFGGDMRKCRHLNRAYHYCCFK
jgi:hypothetical protein